MTEKKKPKICNICGKKERKNRPFANKKNLCKKCQSEYNRQYRKDEFDSIQETSRKYYDHNREDLLVKNKSRYNKQTSSEYHKAYRSKKVNAAQIAKRQSEWYYKKKRQEHYAKIQSLVEHMDIKLNNDDLLLIFDNIYSLTMPSKQKDYKELEFDKKTSRRYFAESNTKAIKDNLEHTKSNCHSGIIFFYGVCSVIIVQVAYHTVFKIIKLWL